MKVTTERIYIQSKNIIQSGNYVKQNGYTSLDSLMREPDVQLLRIPNFGRNSLNELLYSYKRFGLVGRRAELLAKRNKQ